MQKDTEVIHRKVKGGTKITCYLKWNQVRILGNTSNEGFGEENAEKTIPEREPRTTLCDIEYTSKEVVRRRSSRQSESTNRSSMC